VSGEGVALVAAADGTTNALAFADASLFEPVYGPGSAERFAALGPSTVLDAPNLIDDVDTLDDLARLKGRLGKHTRRVLASLDLQSAA
jgi:2-phospho-L-lactate guanylyltransferase (CobY/MobA/RfbA family)